jgi:hypothetical protein
VGLSQGERRSATDDNVETSRGEEPGAGGEGITRRTMIRRSAIAGGTLLWVTPVVQSLGNNSAYAWFRGSQKPGACHCNERILTILPVSCVADPGSGTNPKHRIAHSGKSVTFHAQTAGGCGAGPNCTSEGELISWTEIAAVGCALASQSGDECVVHVTAYPATITLQVDSTLTCLGAKGHATSSCSDSKVRTMCFSQVTGSESQRCGRYPPHINTDHGTQRCH